MLIAVAVASVLIAGLYWRIDQFSPGFRRTIAALAVVSTLFLVTLGSIWPSLYTLVAVVSLPAFYFLGRELFGYPTVKSQAILYCRSVVAAAATCAFLQVWWIYGGCRAVGRCL